jgi:hypothetical protein
MLRSVFAAVLLARASACVRRWSLRLRDDPLIATDAREFRLRQIRARLRVLHLGQRFTSSAAPPVMPSRASICAALASASLSCASVSAADSRTSSAPCETGVPRSMPAATTRPAVSAATSACSSAISEPVARMNRAIGRSVAATADTGTRGGAACSLALASPELQAPDASAATASSAMTSEWVVPRFMKNSSSYEAWASATV